MTTAATTPQKKRDTFPYHMDYLNVVGEIHSRPVSNQSSNSVILHYAFISDGGASVPHTLLTNLCRKRGEPAPEKDASFHDLRWGNGTLRWEKHSEFSTFTYSGPAPKAFLGPVHGHPFGADFEVPGSLISTCRLEIRAFNKTNLKLLNHFDQTSLCVSSIGSKNSVLATDFHQDENGMTVYLLLDDKMPANRLGYYVKSALELETYRTLAMLGLPLARKLSKKIGEFELELSRLTQAIRGAKSEENEKLLNEINALAADLEADAASSLFRFGATRAYGNIAGNRADTIGGHGLSGYVSIKEYLERSLKPAMLTCQSVEARQENISQKLARAANLLRTRVEIAIENQNKDLLASMNQRTDMQYRLQQTVEGLSVAAVSYYVVGLFYYCVKALKEAGFISFSPTILAGLFVPITLILIWVMLQRLKKKHLQ